MKHDRSRLVPNIAVNTKHIVVVKIKMGITISFA